MDYRVNTPCGPLRGTAGRLPGIAAYKGIRYARAGRWEYSVQVTGWEGEYDASRYGNCCYQPRAFYDEAQAPERPSTTGSSARVNTTTTARIAYFSTSGRRKTPGLGTACR